MKTGVYQFAGHEPDVLIDGRDALMKFGPAIQAAAGVLEGFGGSVEHTALHELAALLESCHVHAPGHAKQLKPFKQCEVEDG